MAFETRSQGSLIAQINVVPLVDVMLVLLVIFMVTAPIIQQGISVDLPQAKAGPLEGEDQQFVITVEKNGKISLNDEPITIDALPAKLEAIVRVRPDRGIYLRADRTVPYGEVVQVMAAVRGAGVQNLGMVTELPSQGE